MSESQPEFSSRRPNRSPLQRRSLLSFDGGSRKVPYQRISATDANGSPLPAADRSPLYTSLPLLLHGSAPAKSSVRRRRFPQERFRKRGKVSQPPGWQAPFPIRYHATGSKITLAASPTNPFRETDQVHSMDRFHLRRECLRGAVRSDEVDALLVTSPTNVSYLTGFSGDSSVLFLGRARDLIVSDGRFTTQLSKNAPIWRLTSDGREKR